jgi:hypothetical protein
MPFTALMRSVTIASDLRTGLAQLTVCGGDPAHDGGSHCAATMPARRELREPRSGVGLSVRFATRDFDLLRHSFSQNGFVVQQREAYMRTAKSVQGRVN